MRTRGSCERIGRDIIKGLPEFSHGCAPHTAFVLYFDLVHSQTRNDGLGHMARRFQTTLKRRVDARAMPQFDILLQYARSFGRMRQGATERRSNASVARIQCSSRVAVDAAHCSPSILYIPRSKKVTNTCLFVAKVV